MHLLNLLTWQSLAKKKFNSIFLDNIHIYFYIFVYLIYS